MPDFKWTNTVALTGRADVRVLHSNARIANLQRDAVCLEVRPERSADFRFLETEECRHGFDHGDLRAETRERLPQLKANGAAAEDRQRPG